MRQHLALAGLLENLEHLVHFLSPGQLVQHSITHYPLYHVDYGLLGLTAALYQLRHEVAQVRQVVMVERQTQLQSRLRPLTYTSEQSSSQSDSITFNPEADLGDLDVIVFMPGLLILKHEVVDLLEEGGPRLISWDLKHPQLLSRLDLGHLVSFK